MIYVKALKSGLSDWTATCRTWRLKDSKVKSYRLSEVCIFCDFLSVEKLYIHLVESSCTNIPRFPLETGQRIPETHQWDLLLWWSEGGTGQIWKDCCHGDRLKGQKQLETVSWCPLGKSFQTWFAYFFFYFFISISRSRKPLASHKLLLLFCIKEQDAAVKVLNSVWLN